MRLRTLCAPPGGTNLRQQGAALVVGLVLLLVLTVLGVSGMSLATLELAMANNTQARELAFQAAESGIEIVLAGPLALAAPVAYADRDLGNGFGFDAIVVCSGLSPAADTAMVHFVATVIGRGPRHAVSVHTQGFYVRTAEAAGEDCAANPGLVLNEHARPARTFWRQEAVD